jgi:ADP-ribosylglycohydrolase
MTTSSDLLLGSFIGDALALGPHWIYDPNEISKQLGKITHFHSPLASYHPGKSAGDFTHYGDQVLVLLRSIVKTGRFDLKAFASDWRSFWENPATTSYRDGATRTTLANLQKGDAPDAAASTSHDLAGAAKIAPLFLLPWNHLQDQVTAARALTAFTHNDPAVMDAAEFFTRTTSAIQAGQDIPSALQDAVAAVTGNRLPEMLESALRSSKSRVSDTEALIAHGLSCAVFDGFPGVCHLLFKYPGDPVTALTENAGAGGDSAARGLILGLVYGAAHPVSEWPPEWLAGLKARPEIDSLLQKRSADPSMG